MIQSSPSSWDTHGRAPYSSLSDLRRTCAAYDRAYARLIHHLAEAGRLDTTLVVVLSEFGRSPRLNPAGGRDHWTRCFTVYFAGGGVKGGRAVGESDELGAFPARRPVSPQEVHATMYHWLGMRFDRARPIAELF